MQNNIKQLYQKIKDLKSIKEFEEDIKKIKIDYDGLFNDETAASIIVDKLGRNKENILKIDQLKPGIECTVTGVVKNIQKIRAFNKKNGNIGRVVNIDLSDETGSCGLVLWNKDVELVKNKSIKKNSQVKIINGYVKDGYNGIELNIGRWGLIEIVDEKENNSDLITDEDEDIIIGKLLEIQPTRSFFKDNGAFGFVTNIIIQTKNGKKNITLWDEKVKEIQKYKKGDQIQIKNTDTRNKNGSEEFHLNSKADIKKI